MPLGLVPEAASSFLLPYIAGASTLNANRDVLKDEPRVTVDTFTGLLIDYVSARQAHVIIRGLRAISDFEYEFQIAQMNSCIGKGVETLFMMTSLQYGYLSSSIVKEVCSLNGNIDGFVPPEVKAALKAKFGLH